MATNILMPQLGETVTEGTLTSWSKAVGDSFEPGDILFEIETDKTSMEIPATTAGTLTEILVQAGTLVDVGTVVAVITEAGGAEAPAAAAPAAPAAKAAAAAPAPAPTAAPKAAATASPDKIFGAAKLASGTEITPLARRLAAEAQVSVDTLKGSGPGGRIVGKDVTPGSAPASAPARAAQSVASGPSGDSIRAMYASVGFEKVALDGMRRAIARRLTESKQTIPHFYLTMPILLDPLTALRASLNAAAESKAGGAKAVKLSVNDFVIKAAGAALMRVPAANAVWAEDSILRFRQADISVAVAVDDGLFTPVLRAVDTTDIYSVSSDMKRLATRAREHALLPAEYQGGSLSISNMGMYGVAQFAAIVNPPQAAILAVGAATRVASEAADGSVRFVSQMTVTLSCDHRVIDGSVGAQFLTAFKAAMENPAELIN